MASKSGILSKKSDRTGWLKKLLEWIAGGVEKERKSGDFCRS